MVCAKIPSIRRGGLGLDHQKDRVADILGRKEAPLLVKRDALAQVEGPAFAIWGHRPLLSQFRYIAAGVTIDPDEVFQSRSLIEHATAALQPGEIGVPPQ